MTRRQIIADNGFTDKITLIHGKVEDVELPVDKVVLSPHMHKAKQAICNSKVFANATTDRLNGTARVSCRMFQCSVRPQAAGGRTNHVVALTKSNAKRSAAVS
jgi:hypothetical protein